MAIVALPSTFSPVKFALHANMRGLILLILIGLCSTGIAHNLRAEVESIDSGGEALTDYRDLAQQDWHAVNKSLMATSTDHLRCGGLYVNPLQTAENSKVEGLQASADASAIKADKLLFSGNVLIQYDNMTLQAKEASYDADQQRLVLTDNVIVRTPSAAFGSASAVFDIAEHSTTMQETNYVLHQRHLRGEATIINRTADNTLTIEQGSFTRCQPDNQLWLLSAEQLTLDTTKGQGYAKQAKLSIHGLPIFYFPYTQFPIGNARQSGLLFPNISNSNNGLDLSVPYYFNIAPHLDATFSPRYHAKRGYITQGNARWLNQFDQWNIDLAYLDNDPVYSQQQSNNTHANGKRWLLNIQEQGQWGEHLFSEVDIVRSSDSDYLRDLNSSSLSISRSSHLHQRAQFNFYGEQFSAGIKLQHYQSLIKEPSGNTQAGEQPLEKVPEWYLAFDSSHGPFNLAASGRWQESYFEQQERADIYRRFGEFNIDLPMQWSGIRMSPSIGVQHLSYRVELDDETGVSTDQQTFSHSAPQAAVKLDLLLESNDGQKVLSPGLLYLYRDAEKNYPLTAAFSGGLDSEPMRFTIDQLLAGSPLSGYDYLVDTEQVSLYLNHRRFDAIGNETMALTVGQIFYLKSNNNQINEPLEQIWPGENNEESSALVGEFSTTLTPEWQGSLSLNWNPHQKKWVEGHWQLAYREQENSSNIVNMGYHYRRASQQSSLLEQTLEQADISFIKEFNPRWSLIGRYQYDIEQKRSNETLAGLAFDSCCVRWKVIYRDALLYRYDDQDRRRDRSIFLQIELKGLFGIGSKTDTILSESIDGYRSHDQQSSHYY